MGKMVEPRCLDRRRPDGCGGDLAMVKASQETPRIVEDVVRDILSALKFCEPVWWGKENLGCQKYTI
jgi:hypothetical protein